MIAAIITGYALIIATGALCGLALHCRREYRRATAAVARPRDGEPLTDRDRRILADIERHEQAARGRS